MSKTCSSTIISFLAVHAYFFFSCFCWLPDNDSKLTNNIKHVASVVFNGNLSHPDHFIVLSQDENSILLGARNKIYNLSVYDFLERKDSDIDWPSSDAHSQLCILKGKSEDDCQNYIRILFYTAPGKLLVCGTNSYKPLCRHYTEENGQFTIEKEVEGIGLCPYNPEHNSTAVFSSGQLFSATVADFSGGDPLIYREPQRTEISDLKQLNAPNFVGSLPYEDYIFFFYRETAVEYMNCGKIIYSRVARVCKTDKGGPHQSRDRWTSFLKARLNCSVPGEYPFYFDEIQSTSEVVEGKYGTNVSTKIIYGTLTTPENAISGSAICAYRMIDILRVFEGSFKGQESINANWLPIDNNKVPEPRPGKCARDSRILPDKNVNFIKTHSLMEDAVPAFFGKPILIRVNLQYRFTSIAVDSQFKTVNDETYDVLYIGTDDGKVLKVVHIPFENSTKAVVISENSVLPNSAPVKQLKLTPVSGKIIVVGRDEVRLTTLSHCSNLNKCSDCVELQDPHCAWDTKQSLCVNVDLATQRRYLVQDIRDGNSSRCKQFFGNKNSDKPNDIIDNAIEEEGSVDPIIRTSLGGKEDPECNEVDNSLAGCAVKQKLVIYSAQTLHLVIIGACILCLFVGFAAGFIFSRRFRSSPQFPDAPFIEQHNHLDRLGNTPTSFLTPRPNKAVNLVVNVPSPTPKKDNLDISKDLNIASDGTLQKIKKTYI